MENATLLQPNVFESMARRPSCPRAAEKLHLTQPAVSTQVATREKHMELALFEHLGKKVYLASAGRYLLRPGRKIIQRFRETEKEMAQFKGITLNLADRNREKLPRQLANNLVDPAITLRPPQHMDTVNESFAPHPHANYSSRNNRTIKQGRCAVRLRAIDEHEE